jgi:hypothetical protein
VANITEIATIQGFTRGTAAAGAAGVAVAAIDDITNLIRDFALRNAFYFV